MKRQKRRGPPAATRSPNPPYRRSPWWLLGFGALLVGLIAAVRWLIGTPLVGGVSLPPPPASPADTVVAFADFVGSEACGECHTAEFEAWSGSTHGKAGGAPTPQRVIAPFNGPPIRFRDAVVTPSMKNGVYTFTVAQRGRAVRVFEVDAVVGGGFMVGGGTQAWFSQFPDGTVRFLPFDYSHSARTWFCSPRGSGRGWLPITPDVALADCGDWPPNRILGSSDRFQTCQQCHGSQIDVTTDTTHPRYVTRYTTLAINCESCHGPGRRHIELARSGRIAQQVDIGMPALATLDKDQSLNVCFRCHGLKSSLDPSYLPGENLSEHYALKLPMLLDSIYFPDGRTRSFGYQEGHLSSDCYLNGSMTCVDCHDPHSQQYRDVNGTPLRGRFSNGQCTACHPSKVEPVEPHTHHAAASPGSRCVACHMPYLQQPNVGSEIPYARSDHTIPVPRPLFDSRLGIENACSKCHPDRSPEALQATVTQWYGELKPHPGAVAALLAADTARDLEGAAGSILSGANGRHPWAEFAGLARLLLRHVGPGVTTLSRETVDGLETRARSTDIDVQALALATLHLASDDEPRVRRILSTRTRALGPRDGAVRSRWVWILRVRGDAYLAKGDLQAALASYGKALEVRPHDPAVLRSLGDTYTRLRDYATAIEQFTKSLEQSPGDPQALVGLGFARMRQGDIEGALTAYRQAVAASPWDASAYANLGLAYLSSGAIEPGIEALEKAVELNPSLAAAQFSLARAYAERGRLEEAALALERGLAYDPGNTAARRALEAIRK